MGCGASVAQGPAAPEGETPSETAAGQQAGSRNIESESMPYKGITVQHEPVIELVQPFSLDDEHGSSATAQKGNDADLAELDRLLQSDLRASQPLVLMEQAAPATPPPQQRKPAGTGSLQQAGSPQAGGSLPQLGSTTSFGLAAADQRQQQAAPSGSTAVQEEDPWASLQSKYNPGQKQADQRDRTTTMRHGSGGDEDDDEVVMLDTGNRPDSGGMAGSSATATVAVSGKVRNDSGAITAGGGPPPARAVGGDWGNGELAANGTLMMGHAEPAAAPRLRATGGTAAVQSSDDGAAQARLRCGSTHVNDLGMEDMEDLDALFEDEMAPGGMNPDLASRLAHFEAMNDNLED